MSEAGDGGAGSRGDTVPGVVRLMTSRPVEMPLSAADGQDSLTEQLSERPWLMVAAAAAVVGLVVLLRQRSRR